MASTLFLLNGDLTVDANGDIAVASEPFSLAQDAASAIKLFQGELYYDTSQGIPWSSYLGGDVPVSLIKSKLVAAAKTVPGVVSAVVFITGFSGRTISGQVQISDASGNITAASF